MTRGVFVEIPRLSLWIVTGCQQVTQRDPSSAGLARVALGGLCQLTSPCLFVCLSVRCVPVTGATEGSVTLAVTSWHRSGAGTRRVTFPWVGSRGGGPGMAPVLAQGCDTGARVRNLVTWRVPQLDPC